jgi:hypothetical protein
MNIQKFLAQDIVKQNEMACKWGLRLHFLASDLRTFANAAGTKDLAELKNYAWFQHHFTGGFAAGEGYKSASNETYTGWNFCVRESQSNVINTTSKKGNLGADLISGYAMSQMMAQGLSGLGAEDFSKESGSFHCEHNFQVSHIAELLLAKAIGGQVDPQSLIRFVIDHSLVVTVHNSERKDGGNNRNENVAPFWRYANVGANVLQYTDTGFADVTNATIMEINSNRWNRNKYFKQFRNVFEEMDAETIETFREEVYNSAYMKEPYSSTMPVLDNKNLAILVRNDPTEIATAFYPDKFKDRWKKANNEKLSMA